MNDPRNNSSDTPPSPERDTSREGREEEVINQQDNNAVTNTQADQIVNGNLSGTTGERQFQEGIGDNTTKLDEINKEHQQGSDTTGDEESDVIGGGI